MCLIVFSIGKPTEFTVIVFFEEYGAFKDKNATFSISNIFMNIKVHVFVNFLYDSYVKHIFVYISVRTFKALCETYQ